MGYFDLTGQTAVVTGAATGIGEAVARRLAGAGARVGIADLESDGATTVAKSVAAANQGRAFPLPFDITDQAAVNSAVAEAIRLTGRIDIWVNNAGVAGKAAPLWEQTDEDWEDVMRVNLTGVFRCCRTVIPHMRERQYGRIVNVASVAGKEGNPNMTAYSASKAAVIAFTKSLAKEVAREGICVNSGCPDAHPRPAHRGPDQLHDLEDPHAADRNARGDRRGRALPLEPGLLVRHRPVPRRERRPRDLLT
jgi:3-oxoacyl-[acyl-carrier protein] reductase